MTLFQDSVRHCQSIVNFNIRADWIRYLAPNQPGFSWNPYFSVLVPDIEYDSSGQYGSKICTPYNAQGQQLTSPDGITWWQANLIMMCASAFNGATLSDRISGQSSLAVGTKLDSQQIPGGVFLHEMMHFIGKNSKCSPIF